MLHVEERYGSLYLMSGTSTVEELTRPAVFFSVDQDVCLLSKVGNYDEVNAFYQDRFARAKSSGLESMLEGYYLLELPLELTRLNAVLANPNILLEVKRSLDALNQGGHV